MQSEENIGTASKLRYGLFTVQSPVFLYNTK